LQPMVGARIRDRSRKHKANPIHFYLAAFEVLLARLSGVDDFSIGLSDANRATLDDLATAGFFINLLPIRLQYSANETFGEAIGQARVKVREALLHAKVPFDILLQRLNVPRASTHAPVFQAGFDYRQGQAESGSLGDATLTGVELSRSRAAMDVMLEVMDDPKRDPKITFKLQSSFYAKEDVEALLRSYVNMLATFSRNPALRVEEPRLYARGDVEEAMNIGKGM
jgi:non-ribosomal peptide synthetase component F